MRPILSAAQRRAQAIFARQLRGLAPYDDADKVWARVTGLGGVELALPGELDGTGLGALELCLLAEELGATLADPRLVDGGLLAAELWLESVPAPEDALRRLREHAPAVAIALPDTESSDTALAELFGALHADVRIEARPDRASAGVMLLDVCGEAPAALARLSVPRAAYEAAVLRGRLRRAAYLLGVGRRAQELARSRAASRQLGGRPLIERQAAAHGIARCAIALEVARLEVASAAWHAERGRSWRFRVAAAAAAVVSASLHASRRSAQIHGAAGTSLPDVRAAYLIAHTLAGADGGEAALWDEASRLRTADDGWPGDGLGAGAGAERVGGAHD
jgi:alkylation response protein AidB-like acyl-CoA dehydrogenase